MKYVENRDELAYWKAGRFCPSCQDWQQYAERLQHLFDTNKIQDDLCKRLILLSVLTPKNYNLLRSSISPDQPMDKSFTQIDEMLQKHHTVTPSEIVQGFKFYSRSQKGGESIASYVAKLRLLAEHCNFSDILSTMFRDQLICGINMDTVQKRLLAESRLTFKDALKIATRMEAATTGAQELMWVTTQVTIVEQQERLRNGTRH